MTATGRSRPKIRRVWLPTAGEYVWRVTTPDGVWHCYRWEHAVKKALDYCKFGPADPINVDQHYAEVSEES